MTHFDDYLMIRKVEKKGQFLLEPRKTLMLKNYSNCNKRFKNQNEQYYIIFPAHRFLSIGNYYKKESIIQPCTLVRMKEVYF